MSVFNFTIIASGMDYEADDFEDRFFKAGCDDATISIQKGAIVLEFTREGRNFVHALLSAVKDVQSAGAIVEHIEPDYLVSLSDIAARANISRAAVSLYAKGERAEDFPAPVARVTTESPLWDWVAVARWMFKRRTIARRVVVEAKIVREANLALVQPDGFEAIFAKKFYQELRA
ncbi:hypothetical protein [Bradyrhizobium sp. Ash2021]|uniref:hypothetical protein n=1 Tax=Bradyrhizobium sp. Ash2021 TaxID=2954771 RepID=UPI002816899B|nr:hypothetical protein [Bradyrhizobium sp. Ash2021]WMT78846.1 hypothetical protein NL528_21970 [Bradyrhizobium sp. Ash2021]